MTNNANTLDPLKEKQAQLNARIQRLEAAKKAKDCKRETRQKILIGAYCFEKAKSGGTFEDRRK